MQATSKKAIVTIALNLMQKLEYAHDHGSAVLEKGLQQEKAESSFVQETLLSYLTDCAELYLDKAQNNPESKELIPERTVPLSLDPNDPSYLTEFKTTVTNERSEPAGRFGWCVITRKPADLYCKETRLPVCSLKSKMELIEREHDSELSEFLEVKAKESRKKQLIEDCLLIFRMFLKYAFQEPR